MLNVETTNFINNNIINCIDNNGTNIDTFSETTRNKNNCDKNNKFSNDINVNIFRYKFTEIFTSELFRFSKIHQYDHRKDFKEAWNIWLEDNDDIVSDEVRRLTNLSYDGDILDKMFKSARYYFRKKGTEKKLPTERRNYVGVNKDLLDAMDEHIKSKINNKNYKPSEGFDEFCKSSVSKWINRFCRN